MTPFEQIMFEVAYAKHREHEDRMFRIMMASFLAIAVSALIYLVV